MKDAWRLLISNPASGARNMAVDQAVLDGVARGSSPPTLRLYAWVPACVSLGHAQSEAVVDRSALADRGWHWVRRPTGGRALLHADEVTYSVVAPESHPALQGGVIASYRRLSAGLAAGLSRLGLEVDPPARGPLATEDHDNPVCFQVPSAYEITVGGKKLIGSAQLRRRGAVLQHGALPLTGDLARLLQVLHYPDESARRAAADRLLEHATTLEQALGRPVRWENAARAMAEGFGSALGWDLRTGELTAQERAEASRLESNPSVVGLSELPTRAG